MMPNTSAANRRARFKRIDPEAEQKRNEDLDREVNGRVYSFFLGDTTPFEFREQKYYFRFLPQPEDAQNSWSLTLPYIYLDPNQTPGHRGYLPLTIPQATLLDNIRRALYSHPEFGPLMASENNRNGISLSVKYRSVFMGFCYNDPDPKVQPIALPSNGFTRPKGNTRLQVGTIINQFMHEVDSAGQRKYGDITSLETGSLIGIEVAGNKDRREYIASVDRMFPIDATYEYLLDQVVKFEDIIAYQPNDDIYTVIRLKLTPAMWEFVCAKLQIPARPAQAPNVPQGRTSTAPVVTHSTPPPPKREAATGTPAPRDSAPPQATMAAPVRTAPAAPTTEQLENMSAEELRAFVLRSGAPVA